MTDNFERLLNRPARTAKVTLTLEPDAAEPLQDARRALKRAETRLDANPDDADAQAKQAEAESELDELTEGCVTFTVHLKAIGPKLFEEMLLDHPATDKQKKDARRLNNGDPKAHPQFNLDTFPPAMLSESITKIEFSDDPDNPIESLSEAQASELWGTRWTMGDRQAVLLRAMALNQSTSAVEALGKG